jgi:PAS domain S-box-containing protein
MLNPRIFSSWSVRKKLLLLVLVVLLPVAVIIVVQGIEERANEIEHAKKDALLLVRSIAAIQEQIAVGTKQMLHTLSRLPEVRRLDAQACHQLFRDLLNQYPFYSTIGLATPDGNLVADAITLVPGAVNISEQKHVRDVIKTLDFSSGEYIIGKLSKVQSVHYSSPVLDEDGNLRAIVVAGFDLGGYASFIRQAEMPEGSAVEILDHRGVRLCRLPEDEASAVGKAVPREVFKLMSANLNKGFIERMDEDGIRRIHAFEQLRLDKDQPPYLYLSAGIGKDKILYKANLKMFNSLLVLGVAALCIMSFMWFLGNIVFVRPINRLVLAAQQLGKGEASARTGLPHTSEEIGKLAKSFDEMASLLAAREAEREQLLKSLSESEARFRAIVQDQTELITRFSPSGVVTFGNEANFRCFGVTEDEFVGHAFWHLIPEEEHARIKEHITALSAEQPTGTIIHRVIAAGGKTRWLQWVNRAICDDQGRIVEYQGVGRDVTELRMAREKLAETKQRLQLAVTSGRMGIWEWDIRSDELACDDWALKLYGRTRESLPTRMSIEEWKAAVHPDDLVKLMQLLQSAIDGNGEYDTEFRVVHPDGNIRIMKASGIVVRDKENRPVRMIGLNRDITDRKRVEEALRESEEKYRMLFEHSPLGILHFDKNGIVTSCNDTLVKIIGSSKEHIVGLDLSTSLKDEGMKASFAACISGEIGRNEGEFQLMTGAGAKSLKINYAPVFSRDGRFSGGMAIVEDISERMRAQEALRISEEQLRFLSARLLEAQEEERKRLASEIHDGLGSTLSAVKIALMNARTDLEEEGRVIPSLDTSICWTQHAIDEARGLTMDLRPSILDDFGLIVTVEWLVRRQKEIIPSVDIEKTVDIQEDDIPESLKVVIFRIMQEALHNITKYSQAELVNLTLAKEDGEIRLAIVDNGVGFDPQRAFHTQDKRRGLGLISMKERAELSGGRLSIGSTPGEGTVIQAWWRLGT